MRREAIIADDDVVIFRSSYNGSLGMLYKKNHSTTRGALDLFLVSWEIAI